MSCCTEAPPLEQSVIDEVVASYADRTGDVLGILEELQKRHPNRYLPKVTLEAVATTTGLARSRIFSVATFYSFFNLRPQGRNTVMVCRGTACHTRGAKALHDALLNNDALALEKDGDDYRTADNGITVRNVACFGQCALAPVVAVNERIYSDVTAAKMKDIVKELLDEDQAS